MAMDADRTSRYQWSEANVNGTLMGRYLTRVESGLIEQAFDDLGWPKIILDVGGGDGRLVKPLLAKGVWPVTLECDSVPLAELKESGWNYPLLMGDGNRLPIRDKSLDAVMSFEVAPCTNASHNAGFFKEVFRVLHTGGIFLFVSDNKNSLIGLLSDFNENKGKDLWQRLYYSEPVRDTRMKLLEAGFQIKKVRGFRWMPFTRTSDNKLIPLFSVIEKYLKLGSIVNYSPWLFWAAVK